MKLPNEGKTVSVTANNKRSNSVEKTASRHTKSQPGTKRHQQSASEEFDPKMLGSL